MNLLQSALALQAGRRQEMAKCPVARLLSTLDGDDQTNLQTLIDMDSVAMPALVISKVLRDTGHILDESAINNHRRAARGGAGCKCPLSTTPNG